MQVLAARGNIAEAIAVYQRLRTELREQLGADPCQAVRDSYLQLLGGGH